MDVDEPARVQIKDPQGRMSTRRSIIIVVSLPQVASIFLLRGEGDKLRAASPSGSALSSLLLASVAHRVATARLCALGRRLAVCVFPSNSHNSPAEPTTRARCPPRRPTESVGGCHEHVKALSRVSVAPRCGRSLHDGEIRRRQSSPAGRQKRSGYLWGHC